MKGAQRYRAEALGLLLAALLAQFAWQHLPEPVQGVGWTAAQAAFSLMLLGAVANAYRRPAMWAAVGLAGVWQAMTVGCSVAYIVRPWPKTGGSRCSAALDYPVGVVALGLAAMLAWRIYEGGRQHGR